MGAECRLGYADDFLLEAMGLSSMVTFSILPVKTKGIVGEVDRGTDVAAQIESFPQRELDGNGLFEAAFGDFIAVRRHGELSSVAHAAAIVGEVDQLAELPDHTDFFLLFNCRE
jgi:hypothetical protein